MKDSVKAKLIVFFIIALIAFGVSSAFASLTISEDNDSSSLNSTLNSFKTFQNQFQKLKKSISNIVT